MNNLLLFIDLSVVLLVAYAASTNSSQAANNIFIEASRKGLQIGEVHPSEQKLSSNEIAVNAQKIFANSTVQRRQKRHGYPVPAAPVPVAPAYPAYPPPAYPQPYYPPPSYQVYQPPVQQFIQPPVQQFIQPPVQQFIQPPQPIIQPQFIQPQFIQPPQPIQPQFIPEPIAVTEPPVVLERYPLPSCYNDSSYFLCCNCQLETIMEKSYWELRNEKGPQWNNANIQQIANRVQRNAETMFGDEFEVIVGIGDFATASHFQKDLLCKIEREGRYVLAYATPDENAEYFEEGRAGFPPAQPGIHDRSTSTCDAQTSANLNRELFANTINPYTQNKYVNVADRGGSLAIPFRI